METLTIQTHTRDDLVPITDRIQALVVQSGIQAGLCTLYVPHTTAAVTVNENADPDVARDILMAIDKLIPFHDADYKHMEGNSASHVKACFFGTSETLIIQNGKLVLGTWQGIYFCEFDGPRTRKLHVKITSE